MYLNGCGSTGEGYESASSLVLNSRTGGLQQVVDATDKPGALRGVSMANLMDREQKTTRVQTLKQLPWKYAVCLYATKFKLD